MYIADHSNHRIRKVTVSTQIPTVVPTAIPTVQPSHVPSLVPSNTPSCVPSVIPSNTPSFVPSLIPSNPPVDIITTIAGTGNSSFSGDNGAATSATLCNPVGVTLDSSGRIL